MNRTEFNQWYVDYTTKFPETREWIESKPRSSADTLASWFELLQELELTDCLAATKDIFSGRESPIPAYDRERTPSIIKAIARIHAGNRVAARRQPNWMDNTDDPRVCELCRGGGIVMRQDDQGRTYGWRCPCSKGETYQNAKFKKLGSREKEPLAVWGDRETQACDIYDWVPPRN